MSAADMYVGVTPADLEMSPLAQQTIVSAADINVGAACADNHVGKTVGADKGVGGIR
jgi:hypothetical protein